MEDVLINNLVEGPRFKIVDSRGVEVAQNPDAAWGDVIPYSHDRSALEAMRKDPKLRMSVSRSFGGDNWSIRIDPGRAITSLPSMVLPRLNWLMPHGEVMDFSIRNEEMRPIIEAKLRGRKILQPPPGYAVVEGYIFDKPGQYRIHAEMNVGFRQAHLYPRYEKYGRYVPAFVRRAIEFAMMPEGTFLSPPRASPFNYRLELRSNTVEFEVEP